MQQSKLEITVTSLATGRLDIIEEDHNTFTVKQPRGVDGYQLMLETLDEPETIDISVTAQNATVTVGYNDILDYIDGEYETLAENVSDVNLEVSLDAERYVIAVEVVDQPPEILESTVSISIEGADTTKLQMDVMDSVNDV